MARQYRRRRYSSSRHYNGRSIGHERALQHIREAEELSRDLGGTDKDVKTYFYSLSPAELKAILDDYEREFGWSKREYAEIALPEWRSGRKQMSGLVAGRLYSLLPPRMPLKAMYQLVSNLWDSHSPRSHKVLSIGPDAHATDVEEVVRSHIMDTVMHYTIPEPLERRFNWLSRGDVKVRQQLLNYLLDIEKERAVVGVREAAPTMLRHLREHGDITHRLAHTVQIGNHRFDLMYDENATGVRLEDPRPFSSSRFSERSSGSSYAWVWWLVAAAVLFWILSG